MDSNVAILDESIKLTDVDIHDMESVGSILRRLLGPAETFDPVQSLALDRAIQREEAAEAQP
jgi:hypothetical protein